MSAWRIVVLNGIRGIHESRGHSFLGSIAMFSIMGHVRHFFCLDRLGRTPVIRVRLLDMPISRITLKAVSVLLDVTWMWISVCWWGRTSGAFVDIQENSDTDDGEY